jgi:HD-GYP domain-containing protein (c-di-GMP phosphodiesterase class II)
MLGTYSPVTALDWAVIVQKPSREAYRDVYEMQSTARLLALVAVLLSILVSIFAARRITNPLQVLTQSSRALARGDFSQRVHLGTRTEIGELADTFNAMSEELEHYVEDLKRAADENRELFMGSIQMLAGAVDEKDPYTRGHSDRVTRYSLLIAQEMKQPSSFLETLRISAQLHDVGKIGIEDHILKKPGALTEEEFEVMKTHTTKGANILRPVTQLAEMLPGIELHHEALDGRGYPYGLQGDQIPLLARVIAVADTFDALTTTRPYQRAHTPEETLQIIRNLAGKRLDPQAVEALLAVYARGDIKIQRFTIKRPIAPPSEARRNREEAASKNPPPADRPTNSFLQLRRPVRHQLERSLCFFLGVVHQQTLAIGGDVERYADARRSGVEQTLGRADFDLRSLRRHRSKRKSSSVRFLKNSSLPFPLHAG